MGVTLPTKRPLRSPHCASDGASIPMRSGEHVSFSQFRSEKLNPKRKRDNRISVASFYSTEDEGHHHPRHPVGAAAAGDKLFSLSKSTFTRSSERVSKWTAVRICSAPCRLLSFTTHGRTARSAREGGREGGAAC